MSFSSLKTCDLKEGFRKHHMQLTFFNLKVTQIQAKNYHVSAKIFNI